MTPIAATSHGSGSLSSEERALLKEIADNTRVMAVKLFGSSDSEEENETGRLPKVERSSRHAHQRIDVVERKLAYWAGGLAVLVFILEYALRK